MIQIRHHQLLNIMNLHKLLARGVDAARIVELQRQPPLIELEHSYQK